MKHFTNLLIITAFGGSSVHAQVLFEETFDSQPTAKVSATSTGDAPVAFVDYSNFTLGTTALSIPEAPNTPAGATATSGIVLQANLSANSAQGTNITALETPGGDPGEFSGNYRMTFDMYLSVDPTATTASAGTTEQGGFGIGHDGGQLLLRSNRGSGLSGTWGWIATEGGYNSEDATFYIDEAVQGLFNNVGDANLFGGAFPNASPIPNAPNGVWTEVEVEHIDGRVTVSYNGVEFFDIPSTATDGFAVLWYEDPFGSSLSFSQDYQFGLFDNWKIEVAFPPTIIIEQDGLFAPLNADGATAAGTFLISNENDDTLEVSEVNFSGPDADAFTLDTNLPIMIPQGNSASVDVTFTAGGSFGVKEATIEFVSDDPNENSVTLPLEGIYAAELLAHYKLDETADTTMVEASGNGPDGGLIIRNASLTYARPGLAGGTSLGFTAADAGDVGSFATADTLHVPTTSISMWIKPATGTGGEDTLFNRDPGFTGGDVVYGCFTNDSGALIYRAGGQIVLQSPDAAIVDGDTHHVVITHRDDDGFGNDTATRARMYIDGQQVAENTAPTGFDVYPSNAATSEIYIASRTAAGSGYDGDIDDIQIYSIELTAEQVGNMFAAPGNTAFESVPAPRIIDYVYDEANGTMTLTWESVNRAFYYIESTSTLEPGPGLEDWQEVEDSIMGTGEPISETVDLDGPTRLYRVGRQAD